MAGYASVESVHDSPSVEGEPSSSDIDGSVEVYGDGAGGGSAGRGGGTPFRWGWRHTVLAILSVFVVAVVVTFFIQLPYYALTPGSAPAVSSLITVPSSHRHAHRGTVLLVYVELTPLRALYYPFFWFDSNAAIYPSSEILGSETTAQYATEGEIDMATAQQAATVVALRELGYKVPVVELGALVYGILPGTPAAAALKVGDVISALDGVKVPTYLSLSKRLEGLAPGTTVHLVVSAYPAGKPRTVTLKLGVFRATGTNTYDCFPEGKGTKYKITEFVTIPGGKPHPVACLGIYPQGSGGTADRRDRLQGRSVAGEGGPLLRRDRGPVRRPCFHARAHARARPGRPHRRAQGRRHRDDVDRRQRRRRRRSRPEDDRGARRGSECVLRAPAGVHGRQSARRQSSQGVRREHDQPSDPDPGVARGADIARPPHSKTSVVGCWRCRRILRLSRSLRVRRSAPTR